MKKPTPDDAAQRTEAPELDPNLLPPGLYDQLVTRALQQRLGDPRLAAEVVALSPDTASEALARHLFQSALRVLAAVKGKDQARVEQQLALTNRLIEMLAEAAHKHGAVDAQDAVTPARLLHVLRRDHVRLGTAAPERPSIPLRHSDLIVNGPNDLRVGLEIQRELASADRVDVLVSFVKWTGFIELRDALRAFRDRQRGQPRLRVLTTTYMGATEVRALDALAELGAEVRVSYDNRHTRLHAKAWLFHRHTGFSTGIIGSSNLSHAALRDGCEWNVRLSRVDNSAILRKFEATFAQYWDEGTFEPYDADRFRRAVEPGRDVERDALAAAIRLHPYPHQAEVLDALHAERQAGHHRNLVVAATGTGKTVIAALDYRRLCEARGHRPSLLFVAHRREILEKSRATYRAALGDGAFGELLTGTDRPHHGQHVFASVQSLRGQRLRDLDPAAYDVVVVDEFHHAEARTYTDLLQHLAPQILLGLTATPERADGRSVLHWFDHRVAAESRLWDALDQGLLVPFQYFGVDDHTDLSQIDFRAGRYDVASLEKVYTADTHRADQVLRALFDRVHDPRRMRALGFCVSVAHADFMAATLRERGLPALAITGQTPQDLRQRAVRQLAAGELCALFTVDVFNEGVDIPEVDTVLFLRPTESATLYLQQLGRGLRLHPNKGCLTVLDFIGRAHREFRFDHRFRALIGGGTRAELAKNLRESFPRLPSGCAIHLEESAQSTVLANIERAVRHWRTLAEDLLDDWPLSTFLQRADVPLEDLYAANHSFSELRHLRGFLDAPPQGPIARALPRLLHVDDPDRLGRWQRWLDAPAPPPPNPADPHQLMLFAALGHAAQPIADLATFWADLWRTAPLRTELRQLLAVLRDRCRKPTTPLPGLPFHVHGTYSRDEISAGLGEQRKGKLLRTQGGVYACKRHRCDVLYVTLQKDAADFTPTTLYDDYVLSPRRFHWESQSTTRYDSPTGQRYRSPPEGWRILLFARQARKDARGITMPYLFLGPVRCATAESERPMRVEWELTQPMPAAWYAKVKIAAA